MPGGKRIATTISPWIGSTLKYFSSTSSLYGVNGTQGSESPFTFDTTMSFVAVVIHVPFRRSRLSAGCTAQYRHMLAADERLKYPDQDSNLGPTP